MITFRRQTKWLRRRFLLESRESPAVYRVDSSDPSQWRERCYEPAEQLVHAYLAGAPLPLQPLARLRLDGAELEQNRRTFHCDLCHRDFGGNKQFQEHLAGRRHHQALREKQRLEPPVSVLLVGFDETNRAETAKILKNSFEKPLAEVLELVARVPVEIARIQPRSRAENLRKCLSKHGIRLEIVEKTPAVS